MHRGWSRWWIAFGLSVMLSGLLFVSIGYLLYEGTGIWGNNVPVTWAVDIIGYDWWIGVASGGLAVSTLLLLLGAEWRSALNRIAETTGLIAAAAAGLYPIIHLGRPWFFYWNLPYPNTLLLWPQFRSPLVWDAIDIVSYLLICLSFWYVGLIPDLAALRDRAYAEALRVGARGDGEDDHPTLGNWALLRAQIYGIAALGWRGSAMHWSRWVQCYRAIGLLGTLLVVSLQSGAAVMFAGTLEPGWHDTLLPVLFALGAVFGGLAMTAAVAVALRTIFGLESLITERHLDLLARLLLGFGIANAYCYGWEIFSTLLGGDPFDAAKLAQRVWGPLSWSFWLIVVLALLPVQLFWLRRLRRSPALLFAVGVLVGLGLWFDRYMVIVVTLQGDFTAYSRKGYAPTFWDASTFLGTVGLFFALLLLAVRYLPVISILETRRVARLPAEAPRG